MGLGSKIAVVCDCTLALTATCTTRFHLNRALELERSGVRGVRTLGAVRYLRRAKACLVALQRIVSLCGKLERSARLPQLFAASARCVIPQLPLASTGTIDVDMSYKRRLSAAWRGVQAGCKRKKS